MEKDSNGLQQTISSSTIVSFKNVSKKYGKILANDGLNFDIRSGEIHGIIGENGAGKSTAMKLLYGMEKPSSGEITVKGRIVHFSNSRAAMDFGIGMVHQHFMLSPVHTAVENILLNDRKSKQSSFLNWILPFKLGQVERELEKIAHEMGFKIPWQTPVEMLTVGQQQQIEIIKLLYANVDIMIFDEPTAVLSPSEIVKFLEMLRFLKGQGKTSIIITHKLGEIKEICDQVTVMRQGRWIETGETKNYSMQDLASLMVGRMVNLSGLDRGERTSGDAELKIEHVDLERGGKWVLKGVDLQVHRGEILGIAGIQGNGQQELMHLIGNPAFYKKAPFSHSGKISISNTDVSGLHSRDIRDMGVGVVCADRHREGVLLEESLIENDLLGHDSDYQNSFGFLDRVRANKHTLEEMKAYDVRPLEPEAVMGGLSGGNQQKFVMARELSRKPRLLLCSEPTRGVDVGSIEQIHTELLKASANQMAILLVSSQLDELMRLADRILVMYEGCIVAEFLRDQFDESKIGLFMCGGKA